MKKLKQLITAIKISTDHKDELIRDFIFYSPKMPLRLHQEKLIADSKQFSLKVFDEYFTQSEISINCFSWGNGQHKVLLTHGWASKALDFFELITELKKVDDLEIIAFDAPGNGSSISEFSNLILYSESVKAIALHYAAPDFAIGHSLGVMANTIAFQELPNKPKLLLSIAPLIRMKEKFEQSMDSVNVSNETKTIFFQNFANEFPVSVDYFNLVNLYNLDVDHFLAYDPEDHISPYAFLTEFLEKNPQIKPKSYADIGHYKILSAPGLIKDIVSKISKAIIN